ncbi:MAG: hypothetical protein FJ267_14730, partial [Planctomycetes bacterium]|nr:hypothetical protein [Planctomycetota bacterium]
MKSLIFGSPVSAVLVDASQHRLTIETPSLLSHDNQDVLAQVTVVLELASPLAFFINMLKGAQHLTTRDVVQWVQPAISAVIGSLVRKTKIDDFAYSEELGEHLEDDLADRLKPQLDSVGLRFVRLDLVDFSTPAYEQLCRARGRLSLDKAKQELHRRQRELERQIERESTRDRMDKIDSEAEFREFVLRSDFRQKEANLARHQHWTKLFHDYEMLKGELEAQKSFIQRTRQLQNDI